VIKTEIGFTTADSITVRGKDLSAELLGRIDFVDMAMLTIIGRTCSPREKAMVNLLLVSACDHGLTPSALSARLTYLGAPESLQGAVAAGLLGAGSVFLGTTQNAAEMLLEGAAGLGDDCTDAELASAAAGLVERCRAARKPIYGYGHNLHAQGDPRVPVLAQVSRDNGYFGKHWRLAFAIEVAIGEVLKKPLKMNAVSGIAAIVADMGLDPILARGFMLVGRSAGLLAHLYEERSAPIGLQLWDLVLEQDPRNEVPKKHRHSKARDAA